MQTLSIEAMGIFEPPQTKKVPVAARLPIGLVESLDAVEKLWKLIVAAQGGDPDDVDRTHVLTRLLSVGIDAAFGEFGAKPQTPEEWKKLEQLIAKKFGR